MSNLTFKRIFNSDLLTAKSVISDALSFIANRISTMTTDDYMDLKLIYTELLVNAVIHGNKRDSSKHVMISIKISGNTINTAISDEGNGFDYMHILQSIDNHNILSECGRGMKLVHTLVDSIVFNSTGNEIKFLKRVTSNEQNFNCGQLASEY